jgi:hypothetical protein
MLRVTLNLYGPAVLDVQQKPAAWVTQPTEAPSDFLHVQSLLLAGMFSAKRRRSSDE